MKDKILEYIKEYALKTGLLPTYREIGAGVGLKSSSSLFYYFGELIRDGEIERYGKRYRVRGLKYERCVGN